MGAPNFDFKNGNGLIQNDNAMRTFAAPKPKLTELVVPSGAALGTSLVVITVKGEYLSASTTLTFQK